MKAYKIFNNRDLTEHAVDGGCDGLPVVGRLVVVLRVRPLEPGVELNNLHPESGKLEIIAQLEIDRVENAWKPSQKGWILW